MNVEVEITPNPETLKFVVNKTLIKSGSIEFKNPKEAKKENFANDLFQITGVKNIFISTNFVSVTKTGNLDWSILKPKIIMFLIDYLTSNEIIINKSEDYKNRPKNKVIDKVSKQIKEIIDSKVRPAVAKDGGDIIFEGFKNGIVYLTLKGACSGCPSSTATLKQGIENLLKHYFPEVKAVQATN